MKINECIKLAECAICPYSVKKTKGKLKCDWDEKGKNLVACDKIKKCGSFSDIKNIKIDLSNLEI